MIGEDDRCYAQNRDHFAVLPLHFLIAFPISPWHRVVSWSQGAAGQKISMEQWKGKKDQETSEGKTNA
jgi:hypothetical protein